ncbi:hypothetical protein GCM10009872_08840 [Actinopolymorpha rutila]
MDTLVLSTAAWAVGRAHRPSSGGRSWLEGFEQAANRFTDAVREILTATEDDKDAANLSEDERPLTKPVNGSELTALVRLAANQLGIGNILNPSDLRVHSEIVNREQVSGTASGFLNSFYIDDLARVANAVKEGDRPGCRPIPSAYPYMMGC